MREQIETRLVHFCVKINQLIKTLDQGLLSQNISAQIIRSSTSAALNYGEAQGAESRKDFTHKSGIVLKELRETHVSLKIINESDISNNSEILPFLLDECNQLISIFYKTVRTAQSNLKR